MIEARWQALGTGVVVRLTDPAALSAARAIVEEELAGIDRACSRFRADSELSRVNAQAGRAVAVDELLLAALEVALRAARLTDGDVDPTVGAALVLAGYDRDWALLEQAAVVDRPAGPMPGLGQPAGPMPAPGQPAGLMPGLGQPEGPVPGVGQSAGPTPARVPPRPGQVRRGWQAVEVDGGRGTVRVPPGVQLDLGATAKAWAADRAASAAHEATGSGALVSLGGDIATAGEAPPGGWRIHVTDDHRSAPEAPGQTITIRSGGLATSSIAVRRWRQHGAERHHVIDPASGLPTNGPWRTVSVAAASCADANIATTAALVRGARAAGWLGALGLPARLVGVDGEVRTVGRWPSERAGERVAA